MQELLVFFGHPAREIRVSQMAVACGLWHIAQHSQPLLNGLLAIGCQRFPFRHDVIANMFALLRCHPSPVVRRSPHLILLLWRKAPEVLLALGQLLTILRRHFAQAVLSAWRRDGGRLPRLILRTIIAVNAVIVRLTTIVCTVP